MLLRWALVGLLVVSASAQTDTSRDALFAAIERGAASDVERLLDGGASSNARRRRRHPGADGRHVVRRRRWSSFCSNTAPIRIGPVPQAPRR